METQQDEDVRDVRDPFPTAVAEPDHVSPGICGCITRPCGLASHLIIG